MAGRQWHCRRARGFGSHLLDRVPAPQVAAKVDAACDHDGPRVAVGAPSAR